MASMHRKVIREIINVRLEEMRTDDIAGTAANQLRRAGQTPEQCEIGDLRQLAHDEIQEIMKHVENKP